MRFNDLLHLVAFPWKAHGTPPTSGFVTAAKMPESPCVFQVFRPFQPLHTPVSRQEGHVVRGAGGLHGHSGQVGIEVQIKPGVACLPGGTAAGASRRRS